ncbi:MAG: DNA polymerase I [Ruminiclostridium sp.]|nr:DNA polymerase I [Ruminiclostridium sp.]
MGFLVIDGNSILNRAFYGIRVLTNSRGVATNAVTGFMNTLLMLEKDVQPDMIAVAFDLKAPTFRHKMYDGYKANRKGMPEDLAQQLPYMKKIIKAMGIAIIEKEGYEADDIIGTISAACTDKKIPCTVSTGDRDSFQLVNDYVTVRLAKTKGDVYYTPDVIMEEYGVTPKQMIEVKALMGDTSDNIPGVPGVGEKTALSLIKEFASVDGVYENIGSTLITKGVRTKLENGKDSCYMSRKLAEICLTAPIDTELSHYIPGERDEAVLASLLSELEMYKMLQKLQLHPTSAPAGSKEASEESHAKQIPAMPKGDIIITDDGKVYAGSVGAMNGLSADELRTYADSDSIKYTFDIKDTLTVSGLEKLNNNKFDTTLAAYLADPDSNDYSMSRLCAQYGVPEGNSVQEKSITAAVLNDILSDKISETGSATVLTDIEIPLATVLVAMEREGVKIDIDGIKAFGEEVSAKADKISHEIYEYAGHEFNIGSPKQLGSVLFEKLALPSAKKTKTGYSTNADVLESLMDKHPIIPLITEYRALTKLQNTYVTGLLKVVGEDGRVHSTFKQTETRTGRISSAEPNIQNIPVRTPLGREMRRFFTAKDGYLLVDADYSQIELRVLAHISGDEIMKKAFLDGVDIHTVTASQVFNQPIEWVTPDLRSKAKAVNFGIVYGIGAFSLSKDIGVSVPKASEYIKSYLSKYSGIAHYMEQTVAKAKHDGYVETMFGRRRYIKELAAKNKNLQAFGERVAKNTPIQGTAADIIKIAMIKVYNRLKDSGLDAKLILQVHDELIVEAKEDCADKVAALLKEEMENAVKLTVPMTVDVNVGKTWYDTH